MSLSWPLKYGLVLLIPLFSACSSYQGTLRAPAMPSDAVDHCAVGCPVGGSALTLNRQGYSLNNNATTKFANWVAYRVSKDTLASGRPRNWMTDPDIPAGETLEPADYRGASDALQVDRGHQANLASLGGVTDWQTLNYLSNITPQKRNLDQGPWARLEDKERVLIRAPGVDYVYVATGPLYERDMGKLPGTTKAHTIPSGYWKIIFIGPSPESGLYASFVMDQQSPRKARFCDYQVNVAEIEKRTGLTFWSGLPKDVQAALKAQPGQLASKIGC